jgi:arylsulfatase
MGTLNNQELKTPYNILWIMTDEQRCDSLGCYGSKWAISPSIDRIAAEGTLFEESITPAPLCVPARTSIITGLTVPHHGVWSNADLDHARKDSLITRFTNAGYATASFGKSHYANCHHDPVFSEEHNFSFSEFVEPEHYKQGYSESEHQVIKYESPYTNWILGGNFPVGMEETSEYRAASEGMQWLDNHRENNLNSPFFLRISLNAPHTPVSVPSPWLSSVDPNLIDIPKAELWDRSTWPTWYKETLWEYSNSQRLTAEQIDLMRYYYYCQCAFMDSIVGDLIDYLDANQLLSSTIIAFCSDHGTHLGDYGFVQKQTFFDPVVRVPCIIRVPEQVIQNTNDQKDKNLLAHRIQTPVSLGQLLPTLLDICGLDDSCDYSSLARSVLYGEEPAPTPVRSDYTLGSIEKWGLSDPNHLTMTRFGDWKSIKSHEDQRSGLLFNVKNDPLELHNLFVPETR